MVEVLQWGAANLSRRFDHRQATLKRTSVETILGAAATSGRAIYLSAKLEREV
jgi:hypothetical protein